MIVGTVLLHNNNNNNNTYTVISREAAILCADRELVGSIKEGNFQEDVVFLRVDRKQPHPYTGETTCYTTRSPEAIAKSFTIKDGTAAQVKVLDQLKLSHFLNNPGR